MKTIRELISTLRCERLSSNDDNLRLIDTFYNVRNESLSGVLQNEAFEEDMNGSVAYYVVKNDLDQILFFFSLKSGLLYDQHIDEKSIKLMKKVNAFVQENLKYPNLSEEQIQALTRFMEKIRSHKGFSGTDLENLPNKDNTLFEDLRQELNNNITHVGKTYSAIELVHFCANDAYRSWWDQHDFTYTLGEIIYWQFVANEIIETRKHMGVQYLFLFAADLSDSDKLIQFYQSRMNFTLDTDRATVKPLYDLSCKFMYQDTANLEYQRKDFFEHLEKE